MSLKTRVKVSSVTNLSDARYCAGMGVDLIGFNVDPEHPDYVDPIKFSEITSWLSGVDFAIEYFGKDWSLLEDIAVEYETNIIEIKEPDLLKHPIDEIKYILNFDNNSLNGYSLEGYLEKYKSNYYLYSEEEDLSHFNQVLQLSDRHKIIVGSGINVDNLDDVLENQKVFAIGLKGEEEEEPGFKDYDELADMLEKLEVEV
ncbi:MAG: N-(5'-phosphoribosyl)anthranilate isomerase [Bacteroidota bacterium]